MIELFLPTRNKSVFMPSHLGEADTRKYVEAVQLIFLYQTGQLSLDEFLLQMLYKNLNLKAVPSTDNDKYAELLRQAEVFKSYFNETEEGLSIRLEFSRNPIPFLQPRFTKYYGPKDAFADATFGEYTDALRLFHQFKATPEVQILIDLCAVLYRPRILLSENRKLYDADIAFQKAKYFKHLNIGFLYGVYLYFASFQQYLTTALIPWGGRTLDLGILFEQGEKPEGASEPGIGMDAILFTMAESGAFGTLKETQQANFWTVMIRLYDLRHRDLEQKRQMEQQKAKA